jgi:hypothetical protein
MIMEVYMDPNDAEKFKNFEKVFVYVHTTMMGKLKCRIDITTVTISGAMDYGFYVERYRPSQTAAIAELIKS